MRALVVLLLCSTALAGCSAESPVGTTDDDFDLGQELQATATTGVIRGVVIDQAIVPIAGATVTLIGLGRNATTSENGAFGFSDLEPGTYFLVAKKAGYNTTQAGATVEAGVDRPPVVKILLDRNPSAVPYVVPQSFLGFLACGAAIVATSVGCTTLGVLASTTGSEAIFPVEYDQLPMWSQGELVWEHTQPLGGMFIWEIVQHNYPGSPQPHRGYRETTTSPALAYLDTETIAEWQDWMLDQGMDFRFFGGPHPMCTGVGFGCGVTLDQDAQVFIHHFYNFAPPAGWRYTSDGDPTPPS